MDIETFVKDTISGIVRGVAAAQQETAGTDARINPRTRGAAVTAGANRAVTEVVFSIAVTVEDATAGEGGIKVLGISAGADARNLQSHVSRVDFKVPVAWPTGNGD